MSKEVFRRCGCRAESGKQLGTDCPRLKDARHGTWSYAGSAGVNVRTGKRQQLRKSGFANKKEAQQALAVARTKAVNGRMPADPKITIGEYLTKWLVRCEEDGLRPTTMAGYRAYVKNYFIPSIGSIKLAELQRHQVDTFLRSLAAETMGPTSVRRAHACLRSALGSAVRLNLIDSNPATNIRLPRQNKYRSNVWEPATANEFTKAAEKSRLATLFQTAMHTGLRRGELCGLRWEDVSFKDRELVVKVQLSQVSVEVFEGPVKTNSGQDRVVSLDDKILDELAKWKLQQDDERTAWGDAYQDSGRVFTYEDGRQLRPMLVSQTFDRILKRADLPQTRFHDLRHLHATLLLSAGVPIAIVSKRLGHSTIAITVDLYGHLLRDANREAADAAASMLAPREATAHTLPTQ